MADPEQVLARTFEVAAAMSVRSVATAMAIVAEDGPIDRKRFNEEVVPLAYQLSFPSDHV